MKGKVRALEAEVVRKDEKLQKEESAAEQENYEQEMMKCKVEALEAEEARKDEKQVRMKRAGSLQRMLLMLRGSEADEDGE